MSNNRYSIDNPILENEDIEEDIVLGSFHPTPQDRDLLRADEAVLDHIQKQGHGSRTSKFFNGKGLLKKYKKLASESSSSRKKVGFASGTSDPGNKGYSKLDNSSAYTENNSMNENHTDSDSDEYQSDIEIEIQEGLSRSELRKRTRKLHGILLLFICFIGVWFFYNKVFTHYHIPGNSAIPNRSPKKSIILSNGTHEFHPTTLAISLDGFHPHYVSPELTPNLHMLMTQNSGSPYMIPSFPSSTFPNHWTMVTGLYPSNHGIIGNTFWDEKLNKQFFNTKPGQSLDRVWWGGQPIWQTASKQGLKTAVHMWPGSEVDWNDDGSFEYDKFNGSEILEKKSKRVFEWLDRSFDQRPELILSYVPNVDSVGHTNGINGKELKETLKYVDRLIGDIINGLDARNLTDIVNLVVVSDHGMAPTSNDRLIYLDDLVETNNIEHVDGWPLIGLRPFPSLNLQALYKNLKDAQTQFGKGKWDVYLREDIPEEFHFAGKKFNKYRHRIAPLWLIPKVGYAFTTKEQMKKLNGDYRPHGIHGYNNTEVLMRALFLARGPYFANDFFLPIPNTGLYNILCDTLGIKPSKNDGPPLSQLLQLLPSNWTDSRSYPDVNFSTELLDVNSTYDYLFGQDDLSSSSVSADLNEIKEPHDDANMSGSGKLSSIELHKNSSSASTAFEAGTSTLSVSSIPSNTSTVVQPSKTGTSQSSSLWADWYDYIAGKAQKVGSWVGEKIKQILPNEKNDSQGHNEKF